MSCSCTQYVPSSFLTGLYTVIEDFRDSVAKDTDENWGSKDEDKDKKLVSKDKNKGEDL